MFYSAAGCAPIHSYKFLGHAVTLFILDLSGTAKRSLHRTTSTIAQSVLGFQYPPVALLRVGNGAWRVEV